ncbi:PAS domain-containing protein [Deinococcus taeanensis]|uniref:sensor histidine kinase n=1 Tax=Deinococcus taeanensis TaxID=2737050 RepID=UPI001CDD26C0|nr:ATP-binding protein [Deinococcus taeanensis]UBV42976.1 PAS domain-containing protein [Deinococcus taeanensis]
MTHPSVAPVRFAVAAFDALAAQVALLDRHGEIMAVNAAWRAFAQENGGADSVGANYLALCDATCGEDRENAAQMAAGIRAVLSGEEALFELEYPCHSPAEQRYFMVRVTAFTQDGLRYAVVAHENITRRKLAELEIVRLNRTLEERVEARTRELELSQAILARQNAELEDRNQALAQFAYVASHDLQEPLRTLGAYADILRHRYAGRQLDDRADTYLMHIAEQVFRARQLVRDILTLSNVAAQPPMKVLDLGALADEVGRSLPWPEGAQSSRAELPRVRANAAQVRQLLTNLLGNAIKFRSDRPLRVHLDGHAEGAWVHFTLRDNGIGIAPKHAEQVFVMFQRLHSRTLTGGNGIGLAVCRKVVERHGGRIWIDPEQEAGIAVHFTLPAASGPVSSE